MKHLVAIVLAGFALSCATSDVPEPPDVSAPPPGEPGPVRLPNTASDLPGLGLAGIGSLAAALAIRSVRRRLL